MDENSLVYVVAQLKPAPGKAEELLSKLGELAAAVEANEPGALAYQVFYSETDDEVAVFEVYKDQEAVDAHKTSEHFKQAMTEGAAGILAGPPKIQALARRGGFRRG